VVSTVSSSFVAAAASARMAAVTDRCVWIPRIVLVFSHGAAAIDPEASIGYILQE